MKQLTSPEFRKRYTSENEPVEVTVFGKKIGTWYPVGSDIDAPNGDYSEPTVTSTDHIEPRFTIRPALRPRPIMVTSEKRVLDPLEMRKQANARDDEFMSRTFGPRKKN